jgi:hypothetical protein
VSLASSNGGRLRATDLRPAEHFRGAICFSVSASQTVLLTVVAKVFTMTGSRHGSFYRFSAHALTFSLALIVGCGDGVTLRPEPTEFAVKVTSGGKPVSGINLGLSPADEGLPAGVVLKDGSGQGRAIPGRYMYFVAAGDVKGPQQTKAATAILQTIPKKYHEGDPNRLITVSNGASIDLQLD